MAGRFYKLEIERPRLFVAKLSLSVTKYEMFKGQVITAVSEKLEDIVGEPVSPTVVEELLESKHVPINMNVEGKVYIIECSSSYTDISITINSLVSNVNFQWYETHNNPE
jgi:hypothetical protein